ncbi:uncharacterized protein LOC119464212 isoform X1 [Dermacentor silvarum]|uniref:uncharacterized protein LOC119464212 isoform X1 n=1 Tax=Dermacentor silvarum TaxID=543639 RepID=UPI00210136F2|nr:uncharacterized protein LOC119464212 isoform X1 [Dermacentor silvarum]
MSVRCTGVSKGVKTANQELSAENLGNCTPAREENLGVLYTQVFLTVNHSVRLYRGMSSILSTVALNEYAAVLRKVSNSYRAHFHPTQLLWRKVQEAIHKLHHLCTNRVIGEGTIANQKIGEMDTCIHLLGEKWNIELLRSGNSSLLADLELLRTSVADSAPATVFRPRKELMVVTLLRRMCDEACITLDQLNDTLASRAENQNLRGLRSRRRENFRRLLESVPVLCDGISLTLWIIFCCIRRVNDTELLDELQFDKFLRILKALVKFLENLHSQTSPSQNRWDESCKLCRDCVALLLRHLNNDSTTLYSSLSGRVL